jgi:hypothetical protein
MSALRDPVSKVEENGLGSVAENLFADRLGRIAPDPKGKLPSRRNRTR